MTRQEWVMEVLNVDSEHSRQMGRRQFCPEVVQQVRNGAEQARADAVIRMLPSTSEYYHGRTGKFPYHQRKCPAERSHQGAFRYEEAKPVCKTL